MIALLLKWLAMSVAVWLTATLVPGIKLKSFGAAIGVAAVYGILSALIGWAVWLLTFPIAVLTLGVVVHAILLWITDKIVDEIEISGIGPLLAGAVVMSLTNFLLKRLVGL